MKLINSVVFFLLASCSSGYKKQDICFAERQKINLYKIETNRDRVLNLEQLKFWIIKNKEQEKEKNRCYKKLIYGK